MVEISWKDRVWNTIFSKKKYYCLSCGENVRDTFNDCCWLSGGGQMYLFAPYLCTFTCPYCREFVTVCILCDEVVDDHYMKCPYYEG